MRDVLGRFTFGYVFSVTAAAVVGLLVINYFAKRNPNTPVLGAIYRGLH